jgi:hypothetical protein
MLQNIIILSLVITGIYIVFQQGMILGWLRIMVANWIDEVLMFVCKKLNVHNPLVTGQKVSRYVQKPLWDCLTCMSCLWYIILIHSFNLITILAICGLNSLIDKFLDYETTLK